MKLSKSISNGAFNLTAFAIFGLLFVVKPTTLIPTLILLLANVYICFSNNYRSHWLKLFAGEFHWIAKAFLLWFSMGLFLAVIHSVEGTFHFPENEFRVFMSLPLLIMIASQNSKWWFLSGLCLAGGAAGYWAIEAWPWSFVTRVKATTNNAIHFGNLSALVMMLSATVAVYPNKMEAKFRFLLAFLTFGGFLGVVSSLARSSYVMLLCVVPIFFLQAKNSWIIWIKRGVFIFIFSLIMAVLTFPSVRDNLRVTEVASDFHQISHGNYMTSLGARIAMWRLAWSIFLEHPFVGVRPGEFQNEMIERIEKGEMPLTEIYNQPHSDIMQALSTGGILKFTIYFFCLILMPFVFFYQRIVNLENNTWGHLFSILGMQLVVAYFLTGLTNSNFDLQVYSTTYGVLICVLAKLGSLPEVEFYESANI